MSTFIDGANREVVQREALDPVRLALEYLLCEAIGHKNAKPGTFVANYISAHVPGWTKSKFQQAIVSLSRRHDSDWNIGSCTKGFYLIETQQDFDVHMEAVNTRVSQELYHRDNLARNGAANGWVMKAASDHEGHEESD